MIKFTFFMFALVFKLALFPITIIAEIVSASNRTYDRGAVIDAAVLAWLSND